MPVTLWKDCDAPNGPYNHKGLWSDQIFRTDSRVKDVLQVQHYFLCRKVMYNKLANPLTNRSLINSIDAQY